MSSTRLEIIKNLVPPELDYDPSPTPIIVTAPNPADLPAGLDLKFIRHYPEFITQLYGGLQNRLSKPLPPTPAYRPAPPSPGRFRPAGIDFDIEMWFSALVLYPTIDLAKEVLPGSSLNLGVMHDPATESPSALLLVERDKTTGNPTTVPVFQIGCRFNNVGGHNPIPNGRHLLGQLQRLVEAQKNITLPGFHLTNPTGLPLKPRDGVDAKPFADLVLPTYGAPKRTHVPKPLKHFLQQLWKEMTLRDMTFAAVTEYDFTFFLMRHRGEQALYISDGQSRLSQDPSVYCTMLEITCRAYEDMDYRRNLGINVRSLIPSPTWLSGYGGVGGKQAEDNGGNTPSGQTLWWGSSGPHQGRSLERRLGPKGAHSGRFSVHATGPGFRPVRRLGEKAPAEEAKGIPFPSNLTPPNEIYFSDLSRVAKLHHDIWTPLPPPQRPEQLFAKPANPDRPETTPESSPTQGNLAMFDSSLSRPPSRLCESMPSVNSRSTINSEGQTVDSPGHPIKDDASISDKNQLVIQTSIQDNTGSVTMEGYLDLNTNCCIGVTVKQGRFDFLQQEYEVYRYMEAKRVKGIPSLVGLYGTVTSTVDETNIVDETCIFDETSIADEAYLLLSIEGNCFVESQAITGEERDSFRNILKDIHSAGILHNDLDHGNLFKYQTEGETVLAIAGFHLAEVMGSDQPDLDAMAEEKAAFEALLARSPLY